MEILESVKVCITKAVDKATADGFNVDKGLKAIGLTNQRETTLVWSKSTGAPLHNALVWMDVRTTSVCRSSFFLFPELMLDWSKRNHSFYSVAYIHKSLDVYEYNSLGQETLKNLHIHRHQTRL